MFRTSSLQTSERDSLEDEQTLAPAFVRSRKIAEELAACRIQSIQAAAKGVDPLLDLKVVKYHTRVDVPRESLTRFAPGGWNGDKSIDFMIPPPTFAEELHSALTENVHRIERSSQEAAETIMKAHGRPQSHEGAKERWGGADVGEKCVECNMGKGTGKSPQESTSQKVETLTWEAGVHPFMPPLALPMHDMRPLPDGWERRMSTTTGRTYYFNTLTSESTPVYDLTFSTVNEAPAETPNQKRIATQTRTPQSCAAPGCEPTSLSPPKAAGCDSDRTENVHQIERSIPEASETILTGLMEKITIDFENARGRPQNHEGANETGGAEEEVGAAKDVECDTGKGTGKSRQESTSSQHPFIPPLPPPVHGMSVRLTTLKPGCDAPGCDPTSPPSAMGRDNDWWNGKQVPRAWKDTGGQGSRLTTSPTSRAHLQGNDTIADSLPPIPKTPSSPLNLFSLSKITTSPRGQAHWLSGKKSSEIIQPEANEAYTPRGTHKSVIIDCPRDSKHIIAPQNGIHQAAALAFLSAEQPLPSHTKLLARELIDQESKCIPKYTKTLAKRLPCTTQFDSGSFFSGGVDQS